jgi:hypothetical protein
MSQKFEKRDASINDQSNVRLPRRYNLKKQVYELKEQDKICVRSIMLELLQ